LLGTPHANMGVDCADYDNSGLLSLYVTAFSERAEDAVQEPRKGLFDDVTVLTGAGGGTVPFIAWGCGFVDFDNDGRRDLFVVWRRDRSNIEKFDDTTSYRCRNYVLRNLGNGKFVNVNRSMRRRHATKARRTRRGLRRPRQRRPRGRRWSLTSMNGPRFCRRIEQREPLDSDSPARGANQSRRRRRPGVRRRRDLRQMDEAHSGRGYQSHWGSRLHFGLAKNKRVDRIEVHWPRSGLVDVLENVPVDQKLTIVEGSSPAKGKPMFTYPRDPKAARRNNSSRVLIQCADARVSKRSGRQGAFNSQRAEIQSPIATVGGGCRR